MIPHRDRFNPIVLNILVGLAYVGLGHVTLALGETGGVELRRVIWLPSGLGVAIGILASSRIWPGVGLGAAAATYLAGGAPLHILGTGLGNGIETWLAVVLLRRVAFQPAMERVRDVLLLIGLASGLAALVAGMVSVTSLALVGGVPSGDFLRIWLMWWITHAMGILIVVPVTMTWTRGRIWPARRPFAEVLGVLAAVAVSAWMPFMADPSSTEARLFFLPFPFLLWAAIRLGMAGAAMGALIVTGAAMAAAIGDWGPLSGGTQNRTLVLTWIFANVVVVATLVSAALVVGIERAREAYESGVHRLRAVLDAAGEGIVVADAEGTVTDVNRAMEAIAPPTLEPPSPGDRVEDFLSALGRLRVDPAGDPGPLSSAPAADGSSRTIELADDRVWEVESDRLVGPKVAGGRIWSFRDVTETVRSREERRRLEAQIRHSQKLESLGVLAGGIAHDFNNLLMGIQGRAELLQMEDALSPQAREDVAAIMKTTSLAAELCRQMQAYAGRSGLEVRTLDLSECARDIHELLRASVSKGVELRLELAGDPLLIEGDGTQLRQVILNLVINASEAVAAAGRPGTVTLRTRRAFLDEAWLSRLVVQNGMKPGMYAVADVSDDGIGMDEATATLIFDPFFSSKGAGRGLGLATTLGVIRSHMGGLALDTRPRVGSQFQVALPLTSAGEPEEATFVDMHVGPRVGGHTVLVVDDEDQVREVVSRMLEGLDFTVLLAHDGASALRALQVHQEIDLVLLDLTMPRMSGLETLRALRERGHAVPVLVASGFSADAVPAGTGVVGFVQKPFRRDVLQGWLAEVFPEDSGSARHDLRSELP